MGATSLSSLSGRPHTRAPTPAARRGPTELTLDHRRTFILPTQQGVGLALVLLLMLIGATNYNNALGYGLTFLLGSLGLVSILHTYRNLAGLSVRSGPVGAVFCGETACFPVVLDNRGSRPRFALAIRYSPHARARPHQDAVLTVSLATDEVRRVDLAVPTRQRGWLSLDRVLVATRFPFGLFRAWYTVRIDMRCLVYPTPAGTRELPVHRGAGERDGRAQVGLGHEDFSGLREYVPGDAPRHIHWKAVARGRGIPVKLFEGTGEGRLWLRWDETPGTDLEARVSQLCRWVMEADTAGLCYGLDLPTAFVGLGQGNEHRDACLTELALLEQPDGR